MCGNGSWDNIPSEHFWSGKGDRLHSEIREYLVTKYTHCLEPTCAGNVMIFSNPHAARVLLTTPVLPNSVTIV